jgi:hypothetical protein
MSDFGTEPISLPQAEDLSAAQFKLVKLVSGGLELVDAVSDDVYGVVCNPSTGSTAGLPVGVARYGARKCMAAAAITRGAKVYADAAGKVTSSPATESKLVGVAVEAASGDGSVISVELDLVKVPAVQTYTKSVRCIFATADNVTIGRFVPGHVGRIVKSEIHIDVVTSETTGKTNVATPAIGTAGGSLTPTTGGVITIDVDGATDPDTIGERFAGTAITALNTFTAAQEIGIVMSNTTPLTSGEGTITLTLTKE